MAKQSEAKARVSLDPKPFEDGSKAVIAAANAMSAAVTAAFAAAGAAVAIAFGAKTISGLVDSMKEVVLFGEQMANAGKKAGLAAGQYYLFNSALEKGIGLKTAASLLGANAEVLNRSASVFRDLSIKLWVVGEKIRGFWLGLMDRLAPVLSRLLDGTLGIQLVSAGQAFGEQMAKAVAIIYQLALDGKLWGAIKTGFGIAFDYAGERVLWLGKIVNDIFHQSFKLGLFAGVVDGIAKVWDETPKFTSHFARDLAKVFFDFWIDVAQLNYNLMGKLDKWLNKIHLLSDEDVQHGISGRAKDIASMRDVSAKMPGAGDKYNAPSGTGFVEVIKGIFAANQFHMTDGLQSQIDDFGKMLNETFAKYQSNEVNDPTKTLENNNRRVTSGVDSFAAIGAGGNVYTGLSVLDVNKQQLQELKEINARLGGRGSGETAFTASGGDLTPSDVSRSQTSAPFTTY